MKGVRPKAQTGQESEQGVRPPEAFLCPVLPGNCPFRIVAKGKYFVIWGCTVRDASKLEGQSSRG